MSDSKQIKVNLPLAEYERIREIAAKDRLTLASYLRKLAGADYPNARRRVNRNRDYRRALWHVSRIGNNINQIVRHLNGGGRLNTMILQQLIDIEETLREIVKEETR